MRLISLIVIFGIIGLVAGYLIFGQFNGHYLPILDLFLKPKNILGNLGQAITGAAKIRQNILITGAAGGVIGLFVFIYTASRKRR